MQKAYSLLLIFLLSVIFSCQKVATTPESGSSLDKTTDAAFTNAAPLPSNAYYIDSFDAADHDGDTTETMTVLVVSLPILI